MFEDVVKDLNPADVFNWTGRFDAEEGARKLKNAAFATLAGLVALGKMVPDTAMTHDVLAHSLGLPGGRSFRLIRDCLCHAKLIEKGNLNDQIHLMVTDKGRATAARLNQKLVDEGVLDPETGLQVVEKKDVVPPGAPKDDIAAARQRTKRKKQR